MKVNLIFLSVLLYIACKHNSNYQKIDEFFDEEASIRSCLESTSVEKTDSLKKLKLHTKYNERNVTWSQIVGYMTAYELNKKGIDKLLTNDDESTYLFSFQFKEKTELAFEVSIENDYSTFKELPTWLNFSKVVAKNISPRDIAAYDSLFQVLYTETNNPMFNKNFDQFFTFITSNGYLDNEEEEILDSLINRSSQIANVSNEGLFVFKRRLSEVEILDEEKYR